MEHYGNKAFATKKELYKFLADNHDKLIAQKKAVKKEENCSVIVSPVLVIDPERRAVNKAGDGNIVDPVNLTSLKVVCIINTTNFLDSHMDVHIPGIWNKSLQENKNIMHIQEHDMEFDKIIADGDQLKAYVKPYKWSELGYAYHGETEALVFESEILRKRNEFMLNQYANGWVRSHSVGMFYSKTDMAINDPDYPNYYQAWEKYYPMIVNPEMADERGYFFYVLEAKCIEGSAVPLGSNTATPTMSVGKSIVICPDCEHEFDYNSVNEAGMGYVNCPNCGNTVTEGCVKPKSSSKGINYKNLFEGFKIKN